MQTFTANAGKLPRLRVGKLPRLRLPRMRSKANHHHDWRCVEPHPTSTHPFACALSRCLFCRSRLACALLADELLVHTHKGKWAPLCTSPFTSHSETSSVFCLTRRYGQCPPSQGGMSVNTWAVVDGRKRSYNLSLKFLSAGFSSMPFDL